LSEGGAPRALDAILGYLLRRAHMAFATHWSAEFRDPRFALTPVQGGMLLTVARHDGLTQSDLARMMRVELPTLVGSIKDLVAAGLLKRDRPPEDRRAWSLRLTPLGREAAATVERFIAWREDVLLADFTEAERRVLRELLARIVARGDAVLRAEGDAAAGPPKRRRAGS
jgi:DNA-binding MarR family transcriptional regulator